MPNTPSSTLFAWVHPLAIDPKLDHTWVTNYAPPPVFGTPGDLPAGALYWYCWGSYHPAGQGGTGPNQPGGIGQAPGDLAMSSCICTPNDSSAHGSIFVYAIDGVCHQLANQVLYSTGSGSGSGPLTVKNARGYGISSWLYGTYGSNTSDWSKLLQSCAGTAQPQGSIDGMPDDLDQQITAALGEDFDGAKRAQLRELRGNFESETQVLKYRVSELTADDLSQQLNHRINAYLVQAAEILGPDDYEKLFGTKAGESVTLIDPEMVDLSLKQNR
jgi:hypothetical protein